MAEMGLNRRPLALNYAVNTGVAHGAVGVSGVVTQNAVQLGTKLFDGTPALMVKKGSAKLHGHAI